jgi:hypothetical protein
MCTAVCGSVGQCDAAVQFAAVRQCVAVHTAVCNDNVAVCCGVSSSVQQSVWRCAALWPCVTGSVCGSVRQCSRAAVGVAVHAAMWWCAR